MNAFARRFVFLAVFVAAWAALALPAPVLAQDDGFLIVPVASPVAGQPILVTNDPTSTALDPAMVLALILVLLLVALFALSEIFRYLRDGREDYYKTFRELARKGVYATPVMVRATTVQPQPSIMMEEGVLRESPQEPDRFVMTGPGLLPVGEPGVFNAVLNGDPAADTQWQLTNPEGGEVPALNATLEPRSGASSTFTGLKPGIYHLTATLPGFEMPPPTTITVVEPPSPDAGAPTLPFIGEGYASIVGAILLLAVVVVLAATRAIDADIIGVLLGSIAGYLFGVGISRNTS